MGKEYASIVPHHGKGPYLYDEDGKDYIDYENSNGTCILGHANEKVVWAVKEAAERGIDLDASMKQKEILTDLIQGTVSAAEEVAFVNSETEAIQYAIQLARAYTGKDYIITFKGCYHGELARKRILLADYNDIGSVEELFWQYQDNIAAVLVEPAVVSMGLVLPKDGFLEYLREVTEENKSLLLFDERHTGYRLRLGGASEYYHITPDLICLGRNIASGLPIGLYGGRKEVMKGRKPYGEAVNSVAVAAGIATISELIEKKERYSRMEEQAIQIKEALEQTFTRARVTRLASMFCLFFTEQEVIDVDTAKFLKYRSTMLDHRIYLPSSPSSTCYLSMAHTENESKKTCNRIKSMKKE